MLAVWTWKVAVVRGVVAATGLFGAGAASAGEANPGSCDLTDANLTHADLKGAQWTGATCLNGEQRPCPCPA